MKPIMPLRPFLHVAPAALASLITACGDAASPATEPSTDTVADATEASSDTVDADAPAPDSSGGDPSADVAQPADAAAEGDTDAAAGEADTSTGAADTAAPASPWTLLSQPCGSTRVDALHCDDQATCFIGCGQDANGDVGLHRTTDGGATWAEPGTTPPAALAGTRVNSISRSSDGLLYVAGDLPQKVGVVSLGATGALGTVWEAGTTTDNSFTAGEFARAANGVAFVGSLTGFSNMHRLGDSAPWTVGPRHSVLAVAAQGDTIYGVGATISSPPTVYVSKVDGGAFSFDVVELAASGLGAFRGELWGVAADAAGVTVGGVNQDADVGVVFTHSFGSGDARTAGGWAQYDLRTLFPGDASTWIEGICRGDGVIYAVGRESRQNWGIVLRSTDGGATFKDVSPYEAGVTRSDLPPVYRCQVVSGKLVVAGAGGLFGVYAP